MSKLTARTQFLKLAEQAAKAAGGTYSLKKECRRLGHPADRITVAIDGQVRTYNLCMHYEFDSKGSATEIFKHLFGADRAKWPACLPGSKNKVAVADAAKQVLVPLIEPRKQIGPRIITAHLAEGYRPTGKFIAALAAYTA